MPRSPSSLLCESDVNVSTGAATTVPLVSTMRMFPGCSATNIRVSCARHASATGLSRPRATGCKVTCTASRFGVPAVVVDVCTGFTVVVVGAGLVTVGAGGCALDLLLPLHAVATTRTATMTTPVRTRIEGGYGLFTPYNARREVRRLRPRRLCRCAARPSSTGERRSKPRGCRAWPRSRNRSEVGRAAVIPAGLPPGSDVGNMAILGFDPARYHTGRAPIEAAAMGVELGPDEVAYRCNLVTLSDDQPPRHGRLRSRPPDERAESRDRCGARRRARRRPQRHSLPSRRRVPPSVRGAAHAGPTRSAFRRTTSPGKSRNSRRVRRATNCAG